MAGPAPHQFEFIGGELCLDFTNTVGGSRHGRRREDLAGYAALLQWARQAGVLSRPQCTRLGRQAEDDPQGAATVHSRALALREAIYRIVTARAARRKPAP